MKILQLAAKYGMFLLAIVPQLVGAEAQLAGGQPVNTPGTKTYVDGIHVLVRLQLVPLDAAGNPIGG
jgi:hypothetical protein